MRIKKGDKVMVISGDDKGVQGEVVRVLPSKDRIVVSGVNIVKKHQRPRQGGRSQVQGGIIEFEAPIHISNVMLVDPKSNEPTRVNVRRDDEGKRIRVARKSGTDID
ncbi:MAG: 50S ribosomal protein L24 [Chloroflexi bacterium]|nr:50S ribosomal protein L24 [Chloroflexota bacterium]MBP8058670.1 50S ribosomal protein L24 [Chloroflexota bacterium]